MSILIKLDRLRLETRHRNTEKLIERYPVEATQNRSSIPSLASLCARKIRECPIDLSEKYAETDLIIGEMRKESARMIHEILTERTGRRLLDREITALTFALYKMAGMFHFENWLYFG